MLCILCTSQCKPQIGFLLGRQLFHIDKSYFLVMSHAVQYLLFSVKVKSQ